MDYMTIISFLAGFMCGGCFFLYRNYASALAYDLATIKADLISLHLKLDNKLQ